MIDPITVASVSIVLLFIVVMFIIPVAPDPPMQAGDTYSEDLRRWMPEALRDSDGVPEACRQFYYFTDCPGDCGECWEERIEEGNDT